MFPIDLFRPGQRVDASDLNKIVPFALSRIFAGPGIQILPTGGGICIGAAQRGMRGMGGMGGGTGSTDFQYGKVISLSDDGNKISVYLWVEDEERWETEVTEIYKPHILAADNWNGQTLSGTDGHNVSYYKLTKYSRTAISAGGDTITEFITPPYTVDEVLTITTNPVTGELTDKNEAGRNWASYEED